MLKANKDRRENFDLCRRKRTKPSRSKQRSDKGKTKNETVVRYMREPWVVSMKVTHVK